MSICWVKTMNKDEIVMRDNCIICGAKAVIWYPILKPEYPAFCHEHNKFEFKDKYGCDRDE